MCIWSCPWKRYLYPLEEKRLEIFQISSLEKVSASLPIDGRCRQLIKHRVHTVSFNDSSNRGTSNSSRSGIQIRLWNISNHVEHGAACARKVKVGLIYLNWRRLVERECPKVKDSRITKLQDLNTIICLF